MSSPDTASREPRWVTEQRQRIEKARGPFEAVMPFLGVDRGSFSSMPPRRGAVVADRVVRAARAVREWRSANGQRMQDDEIEQLAIRIAADQFARDIEHAAAITGQDPDTIAWVVAGLRCPRVPFCTGCDGCFTVTSPHRADVQFQKVEGSR
jgi:hypothetical protein